MKVVAVDFDGTLSKSMSGFAQGRYGDPVDGAVAGMWRLRELGYSIIIWTCRGEEDELIAAWCKTHAIPFDAINKPLYENDDDFPGFVRSPKVVADFYIDDRSPEWRGWRKTMRAIEERLAS